MTSSVPRAKRRRVVRATIRDLPPEICTEILDWAGRLSYWKYRVLRELANFRLLLDARYYVLTNVPATKLFHVPKGVDRMLYLFDTFKQFEAIVTRVEATNQVYPGVVFFIECDISRLVLKQDAHVFLNLLCSKRIKFFQLFAVNDPDSVVVKYTHRLSFNHWLPKVDPRPQRKASESEQQLETRRREQEQRQQQEQVVRIRFREPDPDRETSSGVEPEAERSTMGTREPVYKEEFDFYQHNYFILNEIPNSVIDAYPMSVTRRPIYKVFSSKEAVFETNGHKGIGYLFLQPEFYVCKDEMSKLKELYLTVAANGSSRSTRNKQAVPNIFKSPSTMLIVSNLSVLTLRSCFNTKRFPLNKLSLPNLRIFSIQNCGITSIKNCQFPSLEQLVVIQLYEDEYFSEYECSDPGWNYEPLMRFQHPEEHLINRENYMSNKMKNGFQIISNDFSKLRVLSLKLRAIDIIRSNKLPAKLEKVKLMHIDFINSNGPLGDIPYLLSFTDSLLLEFSTFLTSSVVPGDSVEYHMLQLLLQSMYETANLRFLTVLNYFHESSFEFLKKIRFQSLVGLHIRRIKEGYSTELFSRRNRLDPLLLGDDELLRNLAAPHLRYVFCQRLRRTPKLYSKLRQVEDYFVIDTAERAVDRVDLRSLRTAPHAAGSKILDQEFVASERLSKEQVRHFMVHTAQENLNWFLELGILCTGFLEQFPFLYEGCWGDKAAHDEYFYRWYESSFVAHSNNQARKILSKW